MSRITLLVDYDRITLKQCIHFNNRNNFVIIQKLCDMVCDLLLEESNIQPVSTPVTVCGDIHGQVGVKF